MQDRDSVRVRAVVTSVRPLWFTYMPRSIVTSGGSLLPPGRVIALERLARARLLPVAGRALGFAFAPVGTGLTEVVGAELIATAC